MDTPTQIYVIYLLGFLSNDYNFMWLTGKQLSVNLFNLWTLWQTCDWTLIRILVTHSFIYTMLILSTFRLIYNIIYPRTDKPCKNVRFAILFQHVTVANFAHGFLTRAFRGEYVVPDLMVAQIPHWIFQALKEEGTTKDEDYYFMKRLEILSMILVVLKFVGLLVLLGYICNAIVCERCRGENGCRKKPFNLTTWVYDCFS